MGMVTNKTDMMQACIDACNQCAQACFECFNACINEPDSNARNHCISMLIECAMMCQMSAALMSMGGQFSHGHCELCAKICEKCAAECKMFKDDHCQNCSTICQACADECQKMASMK